MGSSSFCGAHQVCRPQSKGPLYMVDLVGSIFPTLPESRHLGSLFLCLSVYSFLGSSLLPCFASLLVGGLGTGASLRFWVLGFVRLTPRVQEGMVCPLWRTHGGFQTEISFWNFGGSGTGAGLDRLPCFGFCAPDAPGPGGHGLSFVARPRTVLNANIFLQFAIAVLLPAFLFLFLFCVECFPACFPAAEAVASSGSPNWGPPLTGPGRFGPDRACSGRAPFSLRPAPACPGRPACSPANLLSTG
jgi:hypothetical protein